MMLVVLLAGLLAGSDASGGARQAQPPEAAGCAQSTCVFLPLALQPGMSALVIIESSGWSHGPTFVYNRCYGLGGTLNSAVPYPLYDVILEARLYDSTGRLLTTARGTTLLHTTLPDTPNAFAINIPDALCDRPTGPDQQVPTFDFVVTSLSTTPPRAYQPISVIAFQACSHPGRTSERTRVTLRNDSRTAVSDVYVTVRYDTFTYFTQRAVDRLPPGTTAAYEPFESCYAPKYGIPLAAIGAEGLAVP